MSGGLVLPLWIYLKSRYMVLGALGAFYLLVVSGGGVAMRWGLSTLLPNLWADLCCSPPHSDHSVYNRGYGWLGGTTARSSNIYYPSRFFQENFRSLLVPCAVDSGERCEYVVYMVGGLALIEWATSLSAPQLFLIMNL